TVPVRVVDVLEAIEIDEQQRELGAVACRLVDRLPHLLGEQLAVRQPGEAVVISELLNTLLGAPAFGHVTRSPVDAGQLAGRTAGRRLELELDQPDLPDLVDDAVLQSVAGDRLDRAPEVLLHLLE